MARLWDDPAETATQFVAVPICTGLVLSMSVPSPSCPLALDPHAQSVPSVFVAMVWKPPVETEAQLPAICIGFGLSVSVPSPIWPAVFCPEAHIVPLVLKPRL